MEVCESLEMAHIFLYYLCVFCWYNVRDFIRFSKKSVKLKMLKVMGKINYFMEKVNCST